jgi:hypothetical protein
MKLRTYLILCSLHSYANFFFFFEVLEIQTKASNVLGKYYY